MMKVNEVYEGDCLDVMREFPDNCIDSIITDPPYGLQFMGKDWDYGLPGAPYWREALRVAKPGATLLAFGGSRTYHRLTCAIEDAGWEIRDCIMWVYGSGFPKSTDISKQLDKVAIVDCQYCNGSGKGRLNYMIFCPEHGEIVGDNDLCPVCDGEVEEIELEREPCKYCGGSGKVKGAEREVIGRKHHTRDGDVSHQAWVKNGNSSGADYCTNPKTLGIGMETAPATPLAVKFDGYGTALKPAVEYIVMAQAPLDGTYAQNAERHGLAGLWIDGSRIPTQDGTSLIGQLPNKTSGSIIHSKDKYSELESVLWEEEKSLTSIIANIAESVVKAIEQGNHLNSVIENVECLLSGEQKKILFDMSKADILCFAGQLAEEVKKRVNTNISSNIDIYGKSTTGEKFLTDQSSITLTEISKIIELKILNLWEEANISVCTKENILPKKRSLKLDVSNKENAEKDGRWPSNLIHDGSEEVMAEFDKAGVRKNHGGGTIHRNESTTHLAGLGPKIPDQRFTGDSGSAARYFAQCPPDPTAHPDAARFHYCPKAGKRERGQGNNHPTVKPLSLLRYLAKLTRPPDGGIVLDPFAGSGTTALACIPEGRDYIIIEKEPEYAELCRRRIAEYSGKEVAPKEIKINDKEAVKQMSLW
jgi:DNA modification methylase